MSGVYEATTRGVRVRVQTVFLEDQSNPDAGTWLWAYRVEVTNLSGVTVQLLRRTWLITDARGQVQRVHGEGVVGEQPVIEPGEAFTYTSGTPLGTPSGFMRGLYHMVVPATGEAFDAVIPPFSLDGPEAPRALN